MKHIVCTILVLLSVFTLKAQDIAWIKASELPKLQSEKVKPVLVFIYTDWCGYCKLMNKKLFSDKEVVSVLNDNFYCVKLNAESKEDIVFYGKTYRYKPKGISTGYHELADFLGNKGGQLVYPTVVVLDEQLMPVHHFAGYLKKEALLEKISN